MQKDVHHLHHLLEIVLMEKSAHHLLKKVEVRDRDYLYQYLAALVTVEMKMIQVEMKNHLRMEMKMIQVEEMKVEKVKTNESCSRVAKIQYMVFF